MRYYYINTDYDALTYSPHAKWIKYGHAFTSGDYEKFGVQGLGKLSPGDILFMYVKEFGVVAAGKVKDSWQGSCFEGKDRLVYQYVGDLTEYRIPVDWFLPIVNNPIKLDDLRAIVGWTPIKVLQGFTDTEAADALVSEIKKRVSMC